MAVPSTASRETPSERSRVYVETPLVVEGKQKDTGRASMLFWSPLLPFKGVALFNLAAHVQPVSGG